jgi:hypothetical protein
MPWQLPNRSMCDLSHAQLSFRPAHTASLMPVFSVQSSGHAERRLMQRNTAGSSASPVRT